LRLLAERGHEIVLGFEIAKKQSDDLLAEALARDYPNVTVLPTELPKRKGGWAGVAEILRGAVDYSRYFDPRYEGAVLLRERLKKRVTIAAPTAERFSTSLW